MIPQQHISVRQCFTPPRPTQPYRVSSGSLQPKFIQEVEDWSGLHLSEVRRNRMFCSHHLFTEPVHMTWSHDPILTWLHDLITWPPPHDLITWPDNGLTQPNYMNWSQITWSDHMTWSRLDHVIINHHMTWSHDPILMIAWLDHMTPPHELTHEPIDHMIQDLITWLDHMITNHHMTWSHDPTNWSDHITWSHDWRSMICSHTWPDHMIQPHNWSHDLITWSDHMI